MAQAKPESCNGCPLYDKPMVGGDGNEQARLVILGQCPGPDEIKEKRPFVGGSGRILERAIHESGFTRASAYVTNCVKCFVKPKTPVPAEAVRKCRPLLEQELRRLPNASTILTLGQEAFGAIAGPRRLVLVHDRRTSKKDLNVRLRGCPERVDLFGRTYQVVPTFHPAFLAYSGFAQSNEFNSDVGKAYRVSIGQARLLDRTVDANPTRSTIQDVIADIISLGSGAVDIETPLPGDLPEDERSSSGYLPVSTIGLAARPEHSIIVRKDQYRELFPLFNLGSREGLANTLPVLWAFNYFDFHNLRPVLGEIDGVLKADAMNLFHLLHPGAMKKDLAMAMSLYTDLPFHKYMYDVDEDLCNCYDVTGCLEASTRMLQAVREFDAKAEKRFPWIRQRMEDLFFDTVMPTLEAIYGWEYDGVKYDDERADELELQVRETLDVYAQWWESNIIDYSWSSPKQLIEFFTTMGCKVPLRKRKDPKTKKVKFTPSVDDEALADFVKQGGPSAEAAKLVQLLREHKKAIDFLTIPRNAEGRVTYRPKVHGQEGGRIQLVKENLQQIPEEICGINPRECYVADCADDLIIQVDYSQIEFWLYCYQSKCKRGLEIKESGDYLYGAFYEEIWGEAFFNTSGGRSKKNRSESTPAWKLLVAKSWPLGFMYGRGVPNPTDQGLPIGRDTAKRIYENFHRDYPEFGALHRELEFLVTRYGYLQSPFGRIRRFTNPSRQWNEYLAFPGQSVAVDVLMHNALVPLSRELPERFGSRSRILFSVHDSVIANVTCHRSLSLAYQTYMFIKETMEAPIPQLDGFWIPVEIKIGPSWGGGMSWEKFERWARDAGYAES